MASDEAFQQLAYYGLIERNVTSTDGRPILGRTTAYDTSEAVEAMRQAVEQFEGITSDEEDRDEDENEEFEEDALVFEGYRTAYGELIVEIVRQSQADPQKLIGYHQIEEESVAWKQANGIREVQMPRRDRRRFNLWNAHQNMPQRAIKRKYMGDTGSSVQEEDDGEDMDTDGVGKKNGKTNKRQKTCLEGGTGDAGSNTFNLPVQIKDDHDTDEGYEGDDENVKWTGSLSMR